MTPSPEPKQGREAQLLAEIHELHVLLDRCGVTRAGMRGENDVLFTLKERLLLVLP